MYIAIDIGGTNTRIVGSDSLENVTFVSEPLRRRNSTDYEDDIAFIVDSARKIGGSNIQAVGIGLVGELSEDKTTSIHSKNNGHWNGKAFAQDISRELGCSVFAENDGVAAALGEAYYGSVTSDFAYVIWGTGIGGALVTHSEDHKPSAALLDWHEYFKEWEYACGGSEIAKLYGKPPEKLDAAEWQEILTRFKQFTSDFMEKTKPRAIVFGGGLSVHHRTELEAMSTLSTPCVVTTFGGDGGMYGGLAVIRQNYEVIK